MLQPKLVRMTKTDALFSLMILAIALKLGKSGDLSYFRRVGDLGNCT